MSKKNNIYPADVHNLRISNESKGVCGSSLEYLEDNVKGMSRNLHCKEKVL